MKKLVQKNSILISIGSIYLVWPCSKNDFFMPFVICCARHDIHCTPCTRFIIFPEKISNVHRSQIYAHRHMYTAAHMWPIFLKFSAFVSVCVSPFFSSSMTSAAIFSFSNQKNTAHTSTSVTRVGII